MPLNLQLFSPDNVYFYESAICSGKEDICTDLCQFILLGKLRQIFSVIPHNSKENEIT